MPASGFVSDRLLRGRVESAFMRTQPCWSSMRMSEIAPMYEKQSTVLYRVSRNNAAIPSLHTLRMTSLGARLVNASHRDG